MPSADATTAKAAVCGRFLFPLLLSICDFCSPSLSLLLSPENNRIRASLRGGSVIKNNFMEEAGERARAGERDCNYRGAQISTDTHLLLLAHTADVGAAAAIALIALQSSRW